MEHVKDAIAQVVFKLFEVSQNVELTRPDPQFGDFSTNVAMQLAKSLGKNPKEIANLISKELQQSEYVNSVEVAGPGFINVTVTNEHYLKNLKEIDAQNTQYGCNTSNTDKTILVEYSDPNPFKPLHAGHLYTTLVGDAVALILEATGANVIRLNYGGDVGRHVGISMWAIIKSLGGEYPEKLQDIAPNDRAQWLGDRYVEGTAAFESSEPLQAEILEINKKVYAIHEQNDTTSDFAKIYWICRQWSYDYFPLLYKKLGVVSFDRIIPESEVTPLGIQTVREQLQKGIYAESEGAVVFNGEKYGLHTRVFINSAGLPTYETKDVGLLLTKWRDYAFDTSIVITANEQAEYMKVMLASVKLYQPEPASRSKHITHGMVKLQGGVKMSSRKGNIVGALEILDSASRANAELTGEENETTTLAAIKYSFLKQRIGGDIIYDPQESVSLAGNSGPYLQYAYVRAVSILRKATKKQVYTDDFTDDERLLARKLDEYQEVVAEAAITMQPHVICTYLYELAQEFNRFYEHNIVVGDEREGQRVALVGAYAQLLANGLRLLGIGTPEKM